MVQPRYVLRIGGDTSSGSGIGVGALPCKSTCPTNQTSVFSHTFSLSFPLSASSTYAFFLASRVLPFQFIRYILTLYQFLLDSQQFLTPCRHSGIQVAFRPSLAGCVPRQLVRLATLWGCRNPPTPSTNPKSLMAPIKLSKR
jgi:hypothetical protein